MFKKSHMPKGQAIDDGDTFSVTTSDGVELIAKIYVDDNSCDRPDERDCGFWPSRNKDDPGYVGENPKVSFKIQQAQAEARMAMWERSDWMYYGIAVTAWIDGVCMSGEFDHALWGIEGNWPIFKGKPNEDQNNYTVDNGYFVEVAKDLAKEAYQAAMKKLSRILMAKGFKVMVMEHEGGSFVDIVYPGEAAIAKLEVSDSERKHLAAISAWAISDDRMLGDYLFIEGSSLIAVIVRIDGPSVPGSESEGNDHE